jgi:hypothetical protein
MGGVDPAAPVRFLETVSNPRMTGSPIFLRSYERSGAAQRVGWLSSIQSEGWLRLKRVAAGGVMVRRAKA